jgi:hypothetical protein
VTASMTKPATARIDELRKTMEELATNAASLVAEGRAKFQEAQTLLEQRKQCLNEISVAAVEGMTETLGIEELMEGDLAVAPATTKHRGRPKGTKNAPKTAKSAKGEAPKHRGRPKGSKNAPKTGEAPKRGRPKGSKNAKSAATDDTEKKSGGLPRACFEVLDRKPKTWYEHVEGLPPGVTGLKASEVLDVLRAEGYPADSKSIDNQVQQAIGKLKDKGLIARGEDRRYYVVEGAKSPWA